MLIGAPISNVDSQSHSVPSILLPGVSLIIATPVIHSSYLLTLSENDDDARIGSNGQQND